MSGFRIFFGGGGRPWVILFSTAGMGVSEAYFREIHYRVNSIILKFFQGRGWSGEGGGLDPAPRMLDK